MLRETRSLKESAYLSQNRKCPLTQALSGQRGTCLEIQETPSVSFPLSILTLPSVASQEALMF